MIVADSSALVAVVFGEPDYAAYADVLDADPVLLSSVSLTESQILVESRHGPAASGELDALVAQVVDTVVPVEAEHARAAFVAWRRFGKGRHPAGLNLGDCFSYATAYLADAPLLFKGRAVSGGLSNTGHFEGF